MLQVCFLVSQYQVFSFWVGRDFQADSGSNGLDIATPTKGLASGFCLMCGTPYPGGGGGGQRVGGWVKGLFQWFLGGTPRGGGGIFLGAGCASLGTQGH